MWWNDLKEIKEAISRLDHRLQDTQASVHMISQRYSASEHTWLFDKLDEILKAIEKSGREIPLKKIEDMLLEFKGCVSMARSAISLRKEIDKEKTKSKPKLSKKTINP